MREAEERKIAEEEAKIRAERDAIERTEREAAEARKRRRKSAAVTTRRPSARLTRSPRSASAARKKRRGSRPAPRRPLRKLTPEAEDDDRRPARRGIGGAPVRPAAAPKTPRAGAPKQRGRLTLVTALTADEVRERSVASFRRRTQRMTGHRDSEHEGKARCAK